MLDIQPITLDINNGEPIARAILPATKRQKQQLHKVPGIRHFWIEHHIGFNDKYNCWCSATLEIDFSVRDGLTLQESIDTMNAAVTHFHEEHENCVPGGQE